MGRDEFLGENSGRGLKMIENHCSVDYNRSRSVKQRKVDQIHLKIIIFQIFEE